MYNFKHNFPCNGKNKYDRIGDGNKLLWKLYIHNYIYSRNAFEIIVAL